MRPRALLLIALPCLTACDDARDEEITRLRAELSTLQVKMVSLEGSIARVQVELAAAREREALTPPTPDTTRLRIDADGSYHLDGASIASGELQARLCERARERPRLALAIAAGPSVPHATVVGVLDAARACAIDQVSLTSP